MAVRGIRGAITVEKNERDEILKKTDWLLREIIEQNHINPEDVASVVFSVTDDIDAEFPAVAARGLGWQNTPLFCAQEIPVPGSLKLCVRVLVHINTEKAQSEIRHVYLEGAEKLRPDLARVKAV